MGSTNIKTFIIVTLLVIFSLSSTYAYLYLYASTSVTGEGEEVTGEGGCFNVDYSGQEINNASIVSALSYTEGVTSQVTLSKDADCDIYTESEIKIHTNDTTTAPVASHQALKYKVVKISGDGAILSGGEGYVNQIGDMTLAKVSLTESDTVYKVYIWLDISLSNGYYDDKTYSGYIFAESVQTSTIK